MKEQAIKILKILEEAGYEAYIIGGSTRNMIHSINHYPIEIKDYDIVSNAPCENVIELFEDTEMRGVQFNVAVVKMDGYEFEIAQYRGETYPEGGSLRPDKVFAVQTLEEDLKRRDFTINAIVMDSNNEVKDLIGGIEDIKNKKIRAIGDANERFAEDPLRMIRAFRFMSQLDYHLETQTKSGIKKNLNLLNKIPNERMKEEFNKTLKGKHASKALCEMRSLDLHKYTFLNSILEEQVHILKSVFELNDDLFNQTINNLDKYKPDFEYLIHYYYILYLYVDYEKAIEEMNKSMFLNHEQIKLLSILLKHNKLVLDPSPEKIYELVKDISEQDGMQYVKIVLNMYKRFHKFKTKHINTIVNKPLFKYQLGVKGTDILEIGKEFDLKPGKWVGQVLNEIQRRTIYEEAYDIKELIKEAINE